MNHQLADHILSALSAIRILPRRMLLETPGVAATIPMLRGVWGAALHDLDPHVYSTVFAPNDETGGGPSDRPRAANRAASELDPKPTLAGGDRRTPAVTASGTAVAAYALRPAAPDPQFAPAMEWILIGDAVQHDATLGRAWDIASGMGLGHQRRRFHLRRIVGLEPDGQVAEHPRPWALDEVVWSAHWRVPTDADVRPAAGVRPDLAARQACRLIFPVPLRLMARKQLIETPTLADVVVAACRRVKAYLPADRLADWEETSRWALETARETPAEPWQGQRLDLHRYSGRQRAE